MEDIYQRMIEQAEKEIAMDKRLDRLSKDDIVEDSRSALYKQDYSSKSNGGITGVSISSLRRFGDDGGSFLELGRFTKGGLDGDNWSLLGEPFFKLAQINHAIVSPGVIKAWHIHLNQEDIWFIPPCDKLVVGLLDLRENSATKYDTMRFVLGDGFGQLLYIPRGVAHGLSNPYERQMQMIYLTNQKFSPESPDEYRLPFDYFVGANFWDIQKG